MKIIIILNDPTAGEKEIAQLYQKNNPEVFQVAYTPKETIGASTNRGYNMADTEYIVYADVDDLRLADAYQRQMCTLNENPGIDFTYGDFIEVEKFGDRQGRIVKTVEFDQFFFSRGSMVGPNHFFRRSLLERSGFWDEQLKSGGDFDFQVRAALNCNFKKTEGVMVYKLMGENTQSASKGLLQAIERTVIELRYGIYDKIDYRFLAYATQYNIPGILEFGEFKAVNKYIPDYARFLEEKSRAYLDKGIGAYLFKECNPLWKMVRRIKRSIRK